MKRIATLICVYLFCFAGTALAVDTNTADVSLSKSPKSNNTKDQHLESWEIEVLENLQLLENLELLQDLDLFQDDFTVLVLEGKS